MRLRSRFWTSAAVSIGSLAALSILVAWSVAASAEAHADEDVARRMQRQILERALVRDEFLLRRDARTAEQLASATVRADALLTTAEKRLRSPDEQAILRSMRNDLSRSDVLTSELAGLSGGTEQAPAAPDSAELPGRLRTEVIRLSHALYAGASRLADAASARASANETRTLVLVILLGIGALVSTAVNALLSLRLVERRVERLRLGAERVGSGDLDQRIAMPGDDELADLARSFDDMTARLQEVRAGLERSNRELEAFSYSVSHDLRAPLRHVTGFVGLLRERAPDSLDATSRHYLDVIADASTRMGDLIDDLLAFSRIGRSEMRRATVSLGPMIESIVQEVSAQAPGRKVSWGVGPLPDVVGDEAMLRQVFRNLVANAFKFTRTRNPARIEVGAVPAGPGRVEIAVQDNGVGFDMKYADKLFQVFQRLHSTEEFEGTGAGLAIVQRIVHRHGGTVAAEGVPDAGATFRVTLPLAEVRK